MNNGPYDPEARVRYVVVAVVGEDEIGYITNETPLKFGVRASDDSVDLSDSCDVP